MLHMLHATPQFRVKQSKGVHICFCSDDADLRPLAVAINSTMQYASRPLAPLVQIATRSKQDFSCLRAAAGPEPEDLSS